MTRRLLTADSVRDSDGVLGDGVLIEDGRTVAVGDADRLRSPDIAEERYPGDTIVPGLRDAHLHPVGYAASMSRPILKAARDFGDVADIIATAARAQSPGSAVVALRLDDETLAEGRLPDRRMLDAVLPDRPALLVRYCGHVAVANTQALVLAGIAEDAPDPPRGSMDRTEEGGLTGVLRETAIDPVSSALRSLAPEVTVDDLVGATTALAAVGLTGVGAMLDLEAGCWAGAGSELDLILEAAHRIPIYMEAFVIADTPAALHQAADRLAEAGGRVRFAGVKMFSDGSLGGHTAAMYDGYADQPDQRGTDRLDPDWAEEVARAALAIGGRVAVHAIGDRANGRAIDLMERLISNGADPALLRIEHASVLTPGDIDRFGRLGVTASVQPAFLASETSWLEKRVGAERLRRTYPFRSLASAGAPLAGGSDSPVEPPHPLQGLAAARDRCGLVPEEGLDAAAALALFTAGAARAIGEDASLAPGSAASLTVLSGDPVTSDPDRVRHMKIVATWVDGEPVQIPDGITTWRG
jgi:hypothetical protein